MKGFLLKLLLFTSIISAIILLFMLMYKDVIDGYYSKFTTPTQTSLVIGDSKTVTGIVPEVANAVLDRKFDLPLYNYSFTLKQMAYGPGWLRVIKQKTDPATQNGLFILSVNPWILAQREGDDFEADKLFEDGEVPVKMHSLSVNPNIEYFFRNFENFNFKAILRPKIRLHTDGWVEQSNIPETPAEQIRASNLIVKQYKNNANRWKRSNFRVVHLSKTIEYLKSHGTVILLRMPGSREIYDIEDKFWPDFNGQMVKLAQQMDVRYIDYSKGGHPFKTYDGLHLDPETAKKFTLALCDSINNQSMQ